ncbi:MAG: CBS domain-containing protein [Acidobacteria bacterium]|nr:CBS domain-containing protein [Acidobacteriota bacterium]
MICPDCGTDNLPGLDNCEECGQDLRSLDIPSARDGLQQVLLETPLREVGLLPPNIVSPGDSVLEAVRLMQKTRHGSVLVVENGKLVGIFTERDVLDRLAGEEVDLERLPVQVVMTPKPQYLGEEDALAFAVHRMAVGHYRHIPVLRDGHPVGFVSIRGVLKFLSSRLD